jgi:hypothetical protein
MSVVKEILADFKPTNIGAKETEIVVDSKFPRVIGIVFVLVKVN